MEIKDQLLSIRGARDRNYWYLLGNQELCHHASIILIFYEFIIFICRIKLLISQIVRGGLGITE